MTITMMNARYLLMGAAVRRIYSGLPPGRLAATLASMGDTCWAVALREDAAGRSDAGIMVGCGLVLNGCWSASTALGFLGGVTLLYVWLMRRVPLFPVEDPMFFHAVAVREVEV